jgi:3'(2'), 5'-bisphosphate nucleotidase
MTALVELPIFEAYRSEAETALMVVGPAAGLAAEIQEEARGLAMQKDDLSPVTVADYALQAIISHKLLEAFPDDPLVAEEGSAALSTPQERGTLESVVDYVRRQLPAADEDDVCGWINRGEGTPHSRYWVLDPIDGTKGFLRGGQYAVALALIENGQVVLGALGCPNLDHDLQPVIGGAGSAVIGVRGQGCWLASLRGGILRRLHVSEESDPVNARLLRSVESLHTNEEMMARLIAELGISTAPIRMDSQAKYAVIAAGESDLIFRLNPPNNPDRKESIWDQAAGSIVVEEAGGRVTDLRGNALDFIAGRQLERNHGVLVSNARLHEAALKALARIGADNPPEAA